MADNVGIITGSGAKIATDQHTSGEEEHYQIIKAAYGTKDTNAFTVVDSTHGLPVALTDGTSTAAILAPGTANSTGNAQLVAATSEVVTFTTTSVQAVGATDVGNYSWVSVQVKSQGTNSTVTFQTSNDNENWVSTALVPSANLAGQIVNATTTANIYHGPLTGRYFRLNVTGISAGTTAGTIIFSTVSKSLNGIGAQITGATSATTGTITTSASAVTTSTLAGYGGAVISIHGTYSGVSYAISVSDDSGTTFYPVTVYDITNNVNRSGTITPGTNASAMYYVPLTGAVNTQVKVLASAYSSGTANIRISVANGPPTFSTVQAQLQDGSGNTINSSSNALNVAPTPYPPGATAITAASGNAANATATATLSGTSGKTTYITGFEICSTGATVGSVVSPTVNGTITGTLTYTYSAPAGVLTMGTPLIVEFSYPIPASGTNVAIAVALPALGSGNTNATVVAHGFQI